MSRRINYEYPREIGIKDILSNPLRANKARNFQLLQMAVHRNHRLVVSMERQEAAKRAADAKLESKPLRRGRRRSWQVRYWVTRYERAL